MTICTAVAHPNIAFIKYWGNLDDRLRLPLNSSISMILATLETRTTVHFDPRLEQDSLTINGEPASGDALIRTAAFLDHLRALAGKPLYARIESESNFPAGAGIASSAAAFAALALAGSRALSLQLSERQLTVLARRGSGSAARSIPGGFVEWHAAERDEESYAETIAPPEHWNLIDCIALVRSEHKEVGSTLGHALAGSSPLQAARVADAPRRLDLCRSALLHRDFAALAELVELDSNLMHAVMMTSKPPLYYWAPESLAIMQAVSAWRRENIEACYTLDAGPNVHVICTEKYAGLVKTRLEGMPGVQAVLSAPPGGPARVVSEG
jgi:diphosphomevalonate decarboxylase